MNIFDLFALLEPVIYLLGVISLILLSLGGAVYLVAWIIKKSWKPIMTMGMVFFCLFFAVLLLGAM